VGRKLGATVGTTHHPRWSTIFDGNEHQAAQEHLAELNHFPNDAPQNQSFDVIVSDSNYPPSSVLIQGTSSMVLSSYSMTPAAVRFLHAGQQKKAFGFRDDTTQKIAIDQKQASFYSYNYSHYET